MLSEEEKQKLKKLPNIDSQFDYAKSLKDADGKRRYTDQDIKDSLKVLYPYDKDKTSEYITEIGIGDIIRHTLKSGIALTDEEQGRAITKKKDRGGFKTISDNLAELGIGGREYTDENNPYHSLMRTDDGDLIVWRRNKDDSNTPLFVNKEDASWQDLANVVGGIGSAIGFGKFLRPINAINKVIKGTKIYKNPLTKFIVEKGTKYSPNRIAKAGVQGAGYDLSTQLASLGAGYRDDIDLGRTGVSGLGGALTQKLFSYPASMLKGLPSIKSYKALSKTDDSIKALMVQQGIAKNKNDISDNLLQEFKDRSLATYGANRNASQLAQSYRINRNVASKLGKGKKDTDDLDASRKYFDDKFRNDLNQGLKIDLGKRLDKLDFDLTTGLGKKQSVISDSLKDKIINSVDVKDIPLTNIGIDGSKSLAISRTNILKKVPKTNKYKSYISKVIDDTIKIPVNTIDDAVFTPSLSRDVSQALSKEIIPKTNTLKYLGYGVGGSSALFSGHPLSLFYTIPIGGSAGKYLGNISRKDMQKKVMLDARNRINKRIGKEGYFNPTLNQIYNYSPYIGARYFGGQ